MRLRFDSDNSAGADPTILDALVGSNVGGAVSYGEDEYSRRLEVVCQEKLGREAYMFPVFNGTGANIITLKSLACPGAAMVSSSQSHMYTDESCAPERVGGVKLLPVETTCGKVSPDQLESVVRRRNTVHNPRPVAVSVTQATELGTVYTLGELNELCECAHKLGLYVHLDAARIYNAAEYLGVSLKDIVESSGADIVAMGGTKNGLVFGDAVVSFNPSLTERINVSRKESSQLASKMRFISAQFLALFECDRWLQLAGRANRAATMLRRQLEEYNCIRFTQRTESNSVFLLLEHQVRERVSRLVDFKVWDGSTGEVRLMCSHDTSDEDVSRCAAIIGDECGGNASRLGPYSQVSPGD